MGVKISHGHKLHFKEYTIQQKTLMGENFGGFDR